MNNNVVIIGLQDFPNGFALTEKMKLVAKIILEGQGRVIIINRKGIVIDKASTNKKFHLGKYKGTIFISLIKKITSGSTLFFEPLKIIFFEPFLMKRCKAKDKKNLLFIGYDYFPFVIYYRIICIVLGYELVINIMEFHIGVNKKSVIKQINAKLFDRFSFYFADKTIVISNKLSNYIKYHHPNLPQFKLPALADFNHRQEKPPTDKKSYIVYCADIGYIEVLYFIINVFEIINKISDIELYLILHGRSEEIEMFKNKISKLTCYKKIVFFTNLEKDNLYNIYFNAFCFVVPLRPTPQDEYRFPQKIAEFTLTKRPIITTNYGEVPIYFNDSETAFISKEYSINSFSQKVIEAINNPELASIVGKKAYILGSKNFNYKNYITSLNAFLKSKGF